jgi:hypothetical protein
VSDSDLDQAIAQWAAQHAPDLIARAQAEALEDARAQLRARLADALFDAARIELAGRGRSMAPARTVDAPSGQLLWVYGVVAGAFEWRSDGVGVDDHPVRLHRHAGVAALVSDVPRQRFAEKALTDRLEDLEALEALARAHEAVLESAMAEGPVVPLRLCTIYSSPERLDAMLQREGLALRASLDRLDGMEEWGVKAFQRVPASASAAEQPPASGAEYLNRRRERRDAADAEREQSEALIAEIHARLAEGAAGAALGRPQDRRLSGRNAEMLLNAAYLVPASKVDEFRLLAEELGRRHEPDGVELELTGPWPPYNFAATPEQ